MRIWTDPVLDVETQDSEKTDWMRASLAGSNVEHVNVAKACMGHRAAWDVCNSLAFVCVGTTEVRQDSVVENVALQ